MPEGIQIGGRLVPYRLFDAAMRTAGNMLQTGFHFEEGGCWAMARALADRLTGQPGSVVVQYQPEGFVHAWVKLDEVALDYTGVMLTQRHPDAVTVGADALEALARAHGVPADEFEADLCSAVELLDTAWQQLQHASALEQMN